MRGILPAFFDSPFCVVTENGWAITPDAPQEIVDQFNAYFAARQQTEKELEAFAQKIK